MRLLAVVVGGHRVLFLILLLFHFYEFLMDSFNPQTEPWIFHVRGKGPGLYISTLQRPKK